MNLVYLEVDHLLQYPFSSDPVELDLPVLELEPNARPPMRSSSAAVAAAGGSSSAKPDGPLSFMTRLSKNIYLLRTSSVSQQAESDSSAVTSSFEIVGADGGTKAQSRDEGERLPKTTASDSLQPELIILAAWMDARDPHVVKYVRRHQVLFPATPILLLKAPMRDMLFTQHAEADIAAHALPIVRDILEASGGSDPADPAEQAAAAAAAQLPKQSEESSSLSPSSKRPPRLLVHVLSNGGSSSVLSFFLVYIRDARRRWSAGGQQQRQHRLDDEGDDDSSSRSTATATATAAPARLAHPIFPRHAIIFDSTPGRLDYTSGVRALVPPAKKGSSPLLSPARLLVLALAHTVTACSLIVYFFPLWRRFMRDPLTRLREEQNNVTGREGGGGGGSGSPGEKGEEKEEGRAATELTRTYVYSKEDYLVGWRDVEEHADEAERLGLQVRRERFDGTAHVAHARGNTEERYWRVVKETWETAVGKGA